MDIPLKKKHPAARHKYAIIGSALLVAVVVYALISASGPRRSRQDASRLLVSEAARGKFMEYIDVEGVAQPRMTIKLNAIEGGVVERVVAGDGAALNAGDTILVLRNPALEQEVEENRDALVRREIDHQEKRVQMARKSSELKRLALETLYKLERSRKQHALDSEEFRIGIQSKARFLVAADEHAFNRESALLLLDELKLDSLLNSMQVDLLEADLARERGHFERVRARLDNLVIVAPVAGQLSFLGVIPGERAGEGSNVGELKVIDRIKIGARVSEYYIDRVSTGLPASISYQGEIFPLTVTRVNPEVKERLFDVDLLFTAGQPENTRVGKNFRVLIELGQPEEALVIDRGSFYHSTGGRWIFKLDPDGRRAARAPITIGRQNPKQYEVLDGLQPGDRVIVSGYDAFGDAEEIIIE
ncbi:MAG: HlyD family efflux transporter periplasmic adaptor subunit [Odoribacteraceae bacterium]|jgi:multidrug efflux pump subunit AcrA (membrane-fusion protein)|nr:HlyD family efflux transporter periplasmic adaptor subunit [Odoribacteraceae bacterium]